MLIFYVAIASMLLVRLVPKIANVWAIGIRR